jgi:hypothetical protein
VATAPDLDDALRELYSSAPDDFLIRRGELAGSLRAAGDDRAAADIAKRRKPTLAAWVVNKLSLHDSSVLERITRLGDELRTTQHALDAPKLRELSAERRRLVADLCGEAFTLAGRDQPAVGLRDEVRSTFDAAVVDPEIAAQLGRLQRAEQFAGFGFSDTAGPPQLTLVRGGKSDTDDADDDGAEPAPEPERKPKVPAAQRRKHERALQAAQEKLANTGLRFEEAQEREHESHAELRKAESQLTAAKQNLDIAKQEYEASRTEVKQAKTAFRVARQSFERLERESP